MIRRLKLIVIESKVLNKQAIEGLKTSIEDQRRETNERFKWLEDMLGTVLKIVSLGGYKIPHHESQPKEIEKKVVVEDSSFETTTKNKHNLKFEDDKAAEVNDMRFCVLKQFDNISTLQVDFIIP